MALITKYAFRGNCTQIRTGDTITISGPCYSCNQPQYVTVPANELERFERGEFAQNCFPQLTADQREFLISGICNECWGAMFPDEESEE